MPPPSPPGIKTMHVQLAVRLDNLVVGRCTTSAGGQCRYSKRWTFNPPSMNMNQPRATCGHLAIRSKHNRPQSEKRFDFMLPERAVRPSLFVTKVAPPPVHNAPYGFHCRQSSESVSAWKMPLFPEGTHLQAAVLLLPCHPPRSD